MADLTTEAGKALLERYGTTEGREVSNPPLPPPRPCTDLSAEHCRLCGRSLVRTVEKEGFDDAGQRRYEAWHSCPRYFMSIWRNLLTLGTGGMGHESHSEREPIMGREWR